MMSYFVQLFFSASLLLLVAMIVSPLFRRQSASFRYKLWNFVMIGLLLLPLLVPLMAQHGLGVIPLTDEEFSQPKVATEIASYYLAEDITLHQQPVTDTQYEKYDSANLRQAELEWERSRMAGTPSSLTLDRMPKAYIGKHIIEKEPADVQHGVTLALILDWLICLWIAGTVVMMFRFLFSLLSARRLLRRMMPIENEAVRALADRIAKRMWVYRSITLLQNEVSTVPFTLGLVRPKIVLPATAVENWTEAQLQTILTHEIAHIQRGDIWGQWLTQWVLCLYWFHPLVWFAAWRIRVTREMACDDLVLLNGEEPADFAEMLLELANSFSSKHRLALGCGVAIFERKNIVQQRITAILNRETRRFPIGKLGTFALLFIATIGLTFASSLSPFMSYDSEKIQLRDFQEKLNALVPTWEELEATAQLRQRMGESDHSEKAEKAIEDYGNQIAMEFRFLSIPEPFANAIITNYGPYWSGLPFSNRLTSQSDSTPIPDQLLPNRMEPAPGFCSLTTTPPLSLFVRLLSSQNKDRLMGIVQSNSRANVLQSPKITFISGKSTQINDVTTRHFVTNLIPVVGDFAVAYQPIIQQFHEGPTLKCRATLLEDRSCRIDECVVEVAGILDVETVPVYNDMALVQVPKVQAYCFAIPEIVIPEGMSLLVAVPGLSRSSDLEPMFVMITPQRIESYPETYEFMLQREARRLEMEAGW